jgi:hypothetical protein
MKLFLEAQFAPEVFIGYRKYRTPSIALHFRKNFLLLSKSVQMIDESIAHIQLSL